MCQSLFLNNVWGLRPAILLKKRLWHRCFPINFMKFLKTPFFAEHLWANASRLNIHIKIIQYWSGVTYCTKVYINLCHVIFQYLIYSFKVTNKDFFKCFIKISCANGPEGDPIADSSLCRLIIFSVELKN